MKSHFSTLGAAAAVFAFASAQLCAAEPAQTEGKVDSVTVYRGQALVTRVAELPGPAGLREVVITNLPDKVLPGSIFAESADGVEVRSVRFRVRPAPKDVREDVRQLDEKIAKTQDALAANAAQQQAAKDHRAYLAKLENFVAPTTTVELTKGVLNAETLKQLTLFLAQQRTDLTAKDLALAAEQKKLQADLDLHQREREQLTASSARNVNEAVVFVNTKSDKSRLRVRYLVDGASWSPSYSFRTDGDRKKVAVEYYASVQQMSGEDWKDVKMTLSTALPSLVATPPTLADMTISLQPAQVAQQQAAGGKGDYKGAKQRISQEREKLEAVRNVQQSMLAQPGDATVNAPAAMPAPGAPPASTSGSFVAPPMLANNTFGDFDIQLNALACEEQVLDLVAEGRVARGHVRKEPGTSESISVIYELSDRTSLPSRADQQLIQIASMPMPAEFYKVATPLLTKYVYAEAKVTNSGKMVLLAGPYSAYVGGEFVGRGDVPTVAVGEKFTAGFGIDSSLRATRELVEKTDAVQGGNRVVDLTYRLAVENFGDAPQQVRVLDRIASARESDVKLTLVSAGREPTSQPATGQKDRKGGIVRWDVSVPAAAIGEQALQIEYKLRLEYDKQMRITNVPLAAAQ